MTSQDAYKQALHDPSSIFKRPDNVVQDPHLTREQKINILIQWEYDARDLQVAEEENMGGNDPALLGRVLAALRELHAGADMSQSSPTKHGGGKIIDTDDTNDTD